MTQVTFSNGVRLDVKPTGFRSGRVRVLARVGGGAMTEPPDQRGLARLAPEVFLGGGLRKHSAAEASQLLAGRPWSWTSRRSHWMP